MMLTRTELLAALTDLIVRDTGIHREGITETAQLAKLGLDPFDMCCIELDAEEMFSVELSDNKSVARAYWPETLGELADNIIAAGFAVLPDPAPATEGAV
jgi:acyl carrier protein